MGKKQYPGCPVLLEYLPFAGLDARQTAVVKKRLTDFNLRTLSSGRGHLEECYATVAAAKRRWRVLRKIRAIETMTIFSGSRSNPVATYEASEKSMRKQVARARKKAR